MKSALIAGVVGLLLSYVSAQDSQDMSAILLVPKVVYSGEANFFVLYVQNQQVDGTADITVVERNDNTTVFYKKSFPIQKSQGASFKLDVSDIVGEKNQHHSYCRVIFEGVFGSTVIRENTTVKISQDRALLLIQTDKKIYKPGQKVFVRVMPLDTNLRPKNKGKISVTISDPRENVIAEWKDVDFTDMVVQFDFQLIMEPALGNWNIVVRYDENGLPGGMQTSSPVKEEVHFIVSEYTLPRFGVSITPPPYFLKDAETARWEICAKYTFGKPVNGVLKINASVPISYWERRFAQPEQYFETKIRGCYNFTLIAASLNLSHPWFESRKIEVFAEVIEDGTGTRFNATNHISRISTPLKLSFHPDDSLKYFRPHMNTYGSLKVTTPDDSPAPDEPIELCFFARSEVNNFHHQRTDVRLTCKNYTSDAEGIISFVIPPHRPSVVSFKVEATATRFQTKYFSGTTFKQTMISQPKATTEYRAFISPSQQYIQFESLSGDDLPCDKPVKLSAVYTFQDTEENLRFRYVVMARARHILSKEVVVAKPTEVPVLIDQSAVLSETLPDTFSDMASASEKKIGYLEIEIDPESTMLPLLTVAIFHVNRSEVVADVIKVPRKVCSSNKVDLSFSEAVVQPGAPIGMTLTASANSQCAYEVVDRSLKLISGDQPNPFLRYRDDLPDREISPWENVLSDRHDCWSENVDSESIFSDAGWTAILYKVNLTTRQCHSEPYSSLPEAVALKIGQAPAALEEAAFARSGLVQTESIPAVFTASESVVDVREYFPESWLFEIRAVDGTGKLQQNLNTPHQVTTWDANAVCIHPTDGLGVSQSKEMKTFQALFTEVSLPYSVKRGETLPIAISVYNYLPHCMPMVITIDPIPGLEAATPMKKEACICPEESPFQYELSVSVTKTSEIGDLNVTVTAVNSEDLTVCSDRADAKTVPSRDKITRQLKVIPEGFMTEQISGQLLCPKGGEKTVTFDLDIPENAINGSARALFSISGDLMGQAVANLDNLITLPTGSGEPNMAKFMSNLLVLEFLNSTGQLTPYLEARLLNNLRSGYQNQLKFLSYDGAYSLWKGIWARPSTFLTAMVYQGFKKAKQYIPISDVYQTNAYEHLLKSQDLVTGCFDTNNGHFSWAQPGLDTSGVVRSSFTAYVLVSLHGALTDEAIIDRAFRCIRAQKNMRQYALALSAYASALYGKRTFANGYLSSLKVYENEDSLQARFYYSTRDWRPESIETTAYAVLAQLSLDGSDSTIQQTLPLIRWLMTQTNSNGGFHSSQDTVIGLQAIGKFAELAFGDKKTISNDVAVTGVDFIQHYKITKSSSNLWDTKVVKTIPNSLSVSSKGTGCVVAISQLRYNVPQLPEEKAFDFNVTVSPTSTVKNLILELCVAYLKPGGQPSRMAIIELSPLSGYVPVKSVLFRLELRNVIQQYEIMAGSVIALYFEEFTATPRCASVELEQVYKVANLKPATAVVYDYYDKSKKNSVEYQRGNLPSVQENL